MVKISIITPVFNGDKFIEDNIKKLQQQSYKNFEHIIIDGKSTDRTVEVLEKYKDIIQYVSEKDSGQSNAINKGFQMATGSIVTWLGVDDYFSDNDVLKRIVKYFEDPTITILEGLCKVIYLDTGVEKLVPQPDVTEESLIRWWNENSVPPQPSIFFRKELLDKYGLLDESLHYCMDHELWLRFLSNGEKFTQINDLLSIYQIHPESKTGSSTPKFVKEHNKVAKRYWGKPWQLKFYRHVAEHFYARYKFKHVFEYLKQ
jgi:glycosyltransferase involved in cell wall biosynthesis